MPSRGGRQRLAWLANALSVEAMTIRRLLEGTAELAAAYLERIPERPVGWSASVDELRLSLGGPLPEMPADPREVITRLAAAAEPGLVASPGGRYFGFVIGGGVPAAVAADWLTSVWDQNAGLYACGPSAAVAEEVAGAWTAELLGLPDGVSFGFVTGCQMAHVTALAAARHTVFARVGWDVNERDLYRRSAPRIAGRSVVRLCDRMPDGARHGAGCRPSHRLRASGLGCQRARPDRGDRDPRRCRRGAPCNCRSRSTIPRARRRVHRAGSRRHAGPDGASRAPRRARTAPWTDDRLRSGRQREHGLVRPAGGDR